MTYKKAWLYRRIKTMFYLRFMSLVTNLPDNVRFWTEIKRSPNKLFPIRTIKFVHPFSVPSDVIMTSFSGDIKHFYSSIDVTIIWRGPGKESFFFF